MKASGPSAVCASINGGLSLHDQLSRVIDSSGGFGEFLEKLNNWADDALYAGKGEPGRLKLPPELQR